MTSVEKICKLLEPAYGRPECKPAYRPLDELILTILSQNTSSVNYSRAYTNLRERFKSWDEILDAGVGEIENAIRAGGLARIKAPRIKKILRTIREERGKLDLDFLSDIPDKEAREYLMQFEGVGIKTASCVLMFSLQKPVLPVDTHVYRITRRLGLIDSSVSAEAAHNVLQAMTPDELVYSFHVNLVTHGRRICKARNPACDICMLLELCPWGRKNLASGVA